MKNSNKKALTRGQRVAGMIMGIMAGGAYCFMISMMDVESGHIHYDDNLMGSILIGVIIKLALDFAFKRDNKKAAKRAGNMNMIKPAKARKSAHSYNNYMFNNARLFSDQAQRDMDCFMEQQRLDQDQYFMDQMRMDSTPFEMGGNNTSFGNSFNFGGGFGGMY